MDEVTNWQIFNPTTGVWALVAMAAVTLFKVWPFILERMNEHHRDIVNEKAGDWERLRAERDKAREQAEMYRALLAECERLSLERLGRAVIAEAELIGRDKAERQTTILPGSEGMEKRDG